MLEKLNQLAEQSARNVSRRQFLGRISRGAVVATGALGAVLAIPHDVSAGRWRCPKGYHWCRWQGYCIPNGKRCRESAGER